MENEKYEAPQVIFEGNLEVQAGTPGSSGLEFDWLDEEF
jgi:hypothetical protein